MQKLTFILDGWELPDEFVAFRQTLPHLQVPTLEKCMRFAQKNLVKNSLVSLTFTDSLKELIRKDLSLPENISLHLIAPISQFMDMHSMQVFYGDSLQLSWTDAHRLVNQINQFLCNDGCECHVYRPHLWVITGLHANNWQVDDVWSLEGRVDSNIRITGSDASKIMRLLTELQMLLFSQNNDERKNLPPINGVWLWQDTHGVAQTSNTIIGNANWLPENENNIICSEINWTDIQHLMNKHKNITVYSSRANQALLQDGLISYADFIQKFDSKILSNAFDELLSGRLSCLSIVGKYHSLQLNKYSTWRFWRKKSQFMGRF
ncbi:MAG: hypothetical protein IKI22_04260 [Neisseriaceae bacterium]|nr:hypothetical protein [Neisseriaceae bacterium]